MSSYVVGVDLGGTNVRASSYDLQGNPLSEKFEIPSHAQSGAEATFDAIAEVVTKVQGATKGTPVGLGLAIPGHIDDSRGVVVWAPNFGIEKEGVFRYWEDVQVRVPLVNRLDIPVWMGNDANLAALGEYRFGSGKNSASCLVLLTVGTGIGGGVVMQPQAVQGNAQGPLLLLGGNKGGAELGHTCLVHNGLDCHAGSYGSIEAYCQRDAIVTRAVHRLRRGRTSVLNDMVSKDWAKVTPFLIYQAASKGDELAIEVFSEVGTMLGVGIGTMINIFAPEIVAIGGQIANADEFLLAPARNAARNIAVPSLFRDCTIVKAEQLEDAGMLGAAALAIQNCVGSNS